MSMVWVRSIKNFNTTCAVECGRIVNCAKTIYTFTPYMSLHLVVV